MKKIISIIGLGYVGLPLAVEFGKIRTVFGFDVNKSRVNQLKKGIDVTLETSFEEIQNASFLTFTTNIEEIIDSEIFIITVPTPIDRFNKPDLTILERATKAIGSILKKNDLVIYESTVFPGATEDICVPILEKESGLTFNKDFYCGYSPERINPGDKNHRLRDIKKVTSGSTPKIAQEVDDLYNEIIKAGTFKTKSIQIAEAAKVIENTQRDLNIALINELSIIFNKLNIDTEAVLEAASSKWNFLHFKPGLVGGHCIGVDPYYLTYKAINVGYSPEIILAGRRLNDKMGFYVVDQVINLMKTKSIKIVKAKILIMGLTFKENCPDIRNTRVIDIYKGFKNHKCNVEIYDPLVDNEKARKEYDIELINEPQKNKFDAIVLAVSHDEFKKLSVERIKNFGKKKCVIYDIKYLISADKSDGRL